MSIRNDLWPPGDGEMAQRIRHYDWAATPLGPIATWPDRLRAFVDLVLDSRTMMSLMWGPEAIQLYNDGYAAGIGERHPAALGHSAFANFADVRDIFEPLFRRAWSGEAVTVQNCHFHFEPGLPRAEGWFDLAYTPVRNATGETAGVLAVVTETTDRLQIEGVQRELEERQAFLLRLSDALRPLADPAEIKAAATRLLCEQLDVNRAFYADADNDRWIVTAIHERNIDPLPVMPYQMADYGYWIIEDFAAGRPLVVREVRSDPRFQPSEQAALDALHIVGAAGVALVKGGRMVAMLTLHTMTRRDWSDAEVELLRETAERTWAAVERAHVEEALRASEANYRTLFETMGQGYCDLELIRDDAGHAVDQRYLALNPAFERIFGIPAAQAQGRTASEVFPALEPWWHDVFDGIARQGMPERIEHEVASLGRWFEVFVYPRGGDRLTVLYEDVTDRKQAEEKRRESDEQQRFLLRFSDALRDQPDEQALKEQAVNMLAEYLHLDRCYISEVFKQRGVSTVGPEYHKPDLAPMTGVFRLADYPETMRQLMTQPIVIPDATSEPGFSDAEKELLASLNLRALLVAPLHRGQHEVIWALAATMATPRQWTEGERSLLELVAERIWEAVERARAEDALRESEQRYRTLFESIDEGYALYELLYDNEGTVVDALIHQVNPAYEILMGQGDSTGKTINDTSDGLTRDWALSLASVAATGVPQRFERYNAQIDRWFDVYVAPAPSGIEHHIVLVFNDSTERRRGIEALQQSEERYRGLFNSIDQGFCTIEVLFDDHGRASDYRFLEINPAFARNTGLDDAVGRSMREFAPAHEEHWFQNYGQVALTREPIRFEAEAAALGRWYNVYAYPVGEPDEHRVAILFEDITERRRAEAALRESESRYRTVLQNLPDYAIILLDPAGIIVEWSEGAERITGYSTAEAVGKPVALIYTDKAVREGQPERELEEAARIGRVEREGWQVRKGERSFWGNEIVTAIRDGSGTLLGFTKISRDLTVQRQATAALRASEERGRAIIEEITDYAIFTTDDAGQIEDWFPGAASVFGWSAEEAVGMPFAATFTPEDQRAGAPEREFTEARRTGSAPDVRWHQHKRGSRVFIEGAVRARYGLDDEFLGVLKIGRDVTKRRVAELEQAESEERRRVELEARVAAATDELRTLSRRLLTVQEEERRFLARELHDEIGQILTGLALTLSAVPTTGQLAHAQRIVGELTDKVRQLSMDLRPAALDAYGLLPAIHSHLERYETSTGIMIELRAEGLDRRFPASVEITAYRVVQEALTNLARYAKTTSGVVQLIADDATLFVSVRDIGVGFDPMAITEGTGIGGMRERVRLLGGHFEIDASPGDGAAITAELPIQPTVSDLHEAAEHDESPA